MLRSFQALRDVNPGFNPEKLLVARVVLPAEKYSSDEQWLAFHEQLLERVRVLPGVSAATGIDLAHIVSGNNFFSFVVEGRPDPPPNKIVDANVRGVMPGFYHIMGIPVRQGRIFTSEDRPQSSLVVVINESMVRRYFANENPVGQRIAFNGNDDGPLWREIAGVVGDVKQVGLAKDAYPEIYLPMPQQPRRYMTVMVRTEGDPLALAGAVRGAVKELDPNQPVYGIQTMEDALSGEIAQERFNAFLLAGFAVIALLLASIGIYGVISYSVSQRTNEIGIRMALGAQREDVFRLVVGQGMLLAAAGLGLGLVVSFALTRFLANLLYGVSATDPVTFAGVSVVLGAVALLACYLPARRAMKVDPMVALRYE